jgi:hypothetical protein
MLPGVPNPIPHMAARLCRQVGVRCLAVSVMLLLVAMATAPALSPVPVSADRLLTEVRAALPGASRDAAMTVAGMCSIRQPAYCSSRRSFRLFSSVSVEFGEQYVMRTYLIMREGVLRAGDLVLLWGAPVVDENGELLHFYWQELEISAWVPTSVQAVAPVRSLSIRLHSQAD